jgi:hypothetical protein
VVPASALPTCFQLLSGEPPASRFGARSSVRELTVAVAPSAESVTRRSAGTKTAMPEKALPSADTRAHPYSSRTTRTRSPVLSLPNAYALCALGPERTFTADPVTTAQ